MGGVNVGRSVPLEGLSETVVNLCNSASNMQFECCWGQVVPPGGVRSKEWGRYRYPSGGPALDCVVKLCVGEGVGARDLWTTAGPGIRRSCWLYISWTGSAAWLLLPSL